MPRQGNDSPRLQLERTLKYRVAIHWNCSSKFIKRFWIKYRVCCWVPTERRHVYDTSQNYFFCKLSITPEAHSSRLFLTLKEVPQTFISSPLSWNVLLCFLLRPTYALHSLCKHLFDIEYTSETKLGSEDTIVNRNHNAPTLFLWHFCNKRWVLSD